MKTYAINREVNQFIFMLMVLWFLMLASGTNAQVTRKVLFLGNSYTAVNNLPQLVHDVALSAGDTLIFDSNAPGGYQLQDHVVDVTSQAKIMAGGWEYVVVQGQSQEPITLSNQFNTGGTNLYNKIRQHNSCAVVMPYMTWGRKNGDPSNCATFPLTCTYQLMDSSLRVRYLNYTQSITGEVSPVSVVWHYLRANYPGIELYQADESHPSLAGSYAAACCFYTSLFKKDPTGILYNPGLSPAEAAAIRNAVKIKVFDALSLWDFKQLPQARFRYQTGSGTNQAIFIPVSQGVRQTYFWNFGDGNTSSGSYQTHSYAANGTYTVSLTTSNCDLQGWHNSYVDTVIQFCSHTPTIYSPHSWLCQYDTLYTQAADAYQWFSNGVPVPETTHYIADYRQYNMSGFAVASTLNGCTELSEVFMKNPESAGYYFDALGDPCRGDTVIFAVLHTNGFLSGSEHIQWLRNGISLSFMANEDTLLISESGKYECKVINPNYHCPFDTTYFVIEYDCDAGVGIQERNNESSWTVFPNPASETITIMFSSGIQQEQIQIYNTIGILLKEQYVSGIGTLHIADLPDGLYFVRLKNNKHTTLKFIKQP